MSVPHILGLLGVSFFIENLKRLLKFGTFWNFVPFDPKKKYFRPKIFFFRMLTPRSTQRAKKNTYSNSQIEDFIHVIFSTKVLWNQDHDYTQHTWFSEKMSFSPWGDRLFERFFNMLPLLVKNDIWVNIMIFGTL